LFILTLTRTPACVESMMWPALDRPALLDWSIVD
jgi:hypothetical protein